MDIKNNQLNIEIPKGMEIDVVNSNLAKGTIKFRKNCIKYDDIYRIIKDKYNVNSELMAVSEHNIIKLKSLDELLDIAKYYNKDWIPNWNNIKEYKYYIYKRNNEYYIASTIINGCELVYFRNAEDAKAVIDNPNFKDILDNIYK